MRDRLAEGRALASQWLGGALAAERWSGARGEMPAHARFEAHVPIDGKRWWLAVIAAEVGGRETRFLNVYPPTDVDGTSTFDHVVDSDFRRALAESMARAGRREGEGAAIVSAPEDEAYVLAAAAPDSRVGSAEQSNTSIIYGDVAIVKLFRRLEPGINPDVEMIGFLTHRGFPHVPALLGTLTIEDARGASVAAMAQRLVPGASDEWAHAVRSATEFVDGSRADYTDEAARLGAVTRAMHDALASDADDPDFAPRPAGAGALARWAERTTHSIAAGMRLLLERAPADAAPIGTTNFVARVDALVACVGGDAGAEVRHHGDYHLGQVLRTPDGALFVIDFEGEPAKPLAERRARHSALRDVAGMLRSFAYAGATAAREHPDDARVAARAAAWEWSARAALLHAYFDGTLPAYGPRTRDAADALLALFELEKLFYELQYELRNRPDWVGIPLAGIRRLTEA